MKLPWLLRVDIACFVGQLISGTFDNDVEALVIALEILTDAVRAELNGSLLPPVQSKYH